MRFRCKVSVCNVGKDADKPVLGSVAIGKKNKAVHLSVSTAKNKIGHSFLMTENVVKCFAKFISEGKLTIRLKEPNKDIMISNVSQSELEMFVKVLHAANSGKELPKLQPLMPTQERHLKAPQTKMTVKNKKEYPFSEGFPVTLTELSINFPVDRLDYRWFKLKNLTKLDFDGARIGEWTTDMEKFDISSFPVLEFLSLADNKIESLGPNFWKGLTRQLRMLNLRKNELRSLEFRISEFPNLHTLDVGENQLTHLPEDLGFCDKLKILKLDYNPIKYLPGSLQRKSFPNNLDTLSISFIDREASIPPDTIQMNRLERSPEVGSLFELTAITLVRNRIPLSTLPRKIKVQIEKEMRRCDWCRNICMKEWKPCFLYCSISAECWDQSDGSRQFVTKCNLCSEKCAQMINRKLRLENFESKNLP